MRRPPNAFKQTRYARALSRSGDVGEAERVLRSVIDANPPHILTILGDICHRMGDKEEAERAFSPQR